MNDIAIRVQNVEKIYRIFDTPADRLRQYIFPRLFRIFNFPQKKYFHEFRALDDISFEVKKGEVFGIIGKNGAGKSTLLQVLCGTLAPSSGIVEVNGRVAALLELGAGFNPEFTGRENVYMNARILGISSDEINIRFQSVLDFAGIGDFIDQPVKTYSSGMYVRLAFSIAIHTEPDILIVDEALSVGDVAFQNKCMLKIKELRSKGTTLLFVTHDLSTLQLICDRVGYIGAGRMLQIGDPVAVAQEYYISVMGANTNSNPSERVIPQKNTGMAEFCEAKHDTLQPITPVLYSVGDVIRLSFSIRALVPIEKTVFAVSIFRSDGDWMIGQTSLEAGVSWSALDAGGVHCAKLVLKPNCLAPGDYLIAFGAYSEDLSICYALSELGLGFSVRANYPTWGKFIHPCEWIKVPIDN